MSDRRSNIAREYCIGCGLCESILGSDKATLRLDPFGFYSPVLKPDREVMDRLERFCPVLCAPEVYSVWGTYESVFLAYAADEVLRKRASSGGVLSASACFILEQGLVDCVIHVGMGEDPIYPQVKVSQTKDEVYANAGSRYIVTAPLRGVMDILKSEPARKYALIARPCDIRALRFAGKEEPLISERLLYMFSFFCAGVPSARATIKMAEALGFAEEEIVSVTYRGNGWPGMASVTGKSGTVKHMSYTDSWGKILGRAICKGCRYCFDGIGEYADISTGDAWYLDKQGNPSFEERDGRNVVFARTAKGQLLTEEMSAARVLVCEPFESRLAELTLMQPFQYERKSYLRAKLIALKLCGRVVPTLDYKLLKKYEPLVSMNKRAKMFFGTVLRIVRKEI